MTGSLVDRATTDLLIGPDWAMNLAICDSLNRDPGLAKDVVRGIKKRIVHKNPKVQLLALTLLETVVKNCGDMVHVHVAEKDLPREMAKIAKKKPERNVRDKILVLIDTWQEAFGGPRARYPQYYAAYQELLRAGAVFPKRDERTAPVFTPQKHPPSSRRTSQSSDHQQGKSRISTGSEFPIMSLAEIQNARGVTDVLSEMLNALDPGNKEGLREEVIGDLIQQCLSYKQRLVHLVNSTSDEDLLCHGLALNDDLQLVLAKRDALASAIAVLAEKARSPRALVDVDDPSTNLDCNLQPDQRSDTSRHTSSQLPHQQLMMSASSPSNGTASPSARSRAPIDLLSGEDLNTPPVENPRAIVPVGELPQDSTMEQHALVLADVFTKSDDDGTNDQGLPLPPWEVEPLEGSQAASPQARSTHNGVVEGVTHPQMVQGYPLQASTYLSGLCPQPMHGGGYPYGYHECVQRPPCHFSTPNEISRGMYGLSTQDSCGCTNAGRPYQMPTTSSSSSFYVQQFNKPSKPEDKLFSDLLNMAKSKQNKPPASDAGNP